MTKRSKSKYPALNKGLNLKGRKDFIEVDYIDGVEGVNGGQGIRPLNESEKAWLNKFYEETVVTNFNHHPELKRLAKEKKEIIECKLVKQMQKQVEELRKSGDSHKQMINEIKQMIKLTKEQNKENNYKKIRKIEKEMQDVRDIVLLYPDKEDHKQFYNDNNHRNNCIYNTCKKTGTLLELDTDARDKFTATYLENLDWEMLLVNEIEDDEDE